MKNNLQTTAISNLFIIFGTLLVFSLGCNETPKTPGGTSGTTQDQTACCSRPPDGYIKIDDSWDPNSCGNPQSVVYNSCTFTRYDNKTAGEVLTICAGQIPAGWTKVPGSDSWQPTRCGHPDSSDVLNVIQIQKQ